MKKTGKYIIGLFLLIISAVILANSLIAAEIHDAVNNGDFDKVKELINNDPGIIDSRTIDGSTPLHLAVMKQNHEIVTFLIEKGSDINTKDVYGRTPADKAQIMNDDRMAGLLRQHDAVESGLLSRDLRGGYLGQKLPG
ncbi:MAG: ankyrin repeat domain-containing protein, partial [bacterium]|nr:ankyrin repeat domain-containing protein [bacterium]